jgi:cyclic pyranopterin phosphate synthase
MVDVGDKPVTRREAVAEGTVRLSREAFEAVTGAMVPKGDVLAAARIAGIQAAKRTSEWIPLAHPLPLDSVEIALEPLPDPPGLRVEARVRVSGRTGVEMEALVAVAAAALTVYDMCKSLDRAIEVDGIRLVEKTGGKSGAWRRGS